MTGRSTVTRTIRIDSSYDEVLRKVAENSGYSVNALMDQILKVWIDDTRFYKLGDSVRISNAVLGYMLNLLEDDEIEEMASRVSIEEAKERLMMRGKPINLESVFQYVDNVLGGVNGWFSCEYSLNHREHSLHLSHQKGYKWSHFLVNYVGSLLKGILHLEPQISIFRNAVNIQLRVD